MCVHAPQLWRNTGKRQLTRRTHSHGVTSAAAAGAAATAWCQGSTHISLDQMSQCQGHGRACTARCVVERCHSSQRRARQAAARPLQRAWPQYQITERHGIPRKRARARHPPAERSKITIHNGETHLWVNCTGDTPLRVVLATRRAPCSFHLYNIYNTLTTVNCDGGRDGLPQRHRKILWQQHARLMAWRTAPGTSGQR